MTIYQSKSALRHQAPPSMSLDETRPLVVIVDDDAAIRKALSELLLSVGIDFDLFCLDARVSRCRGSGSPGLPDPRGAPAGVERTRPAEPARLQRQYEAGHLSHRPWRYRDDRAGNARRSDRFLDQAVSAPGSARCRQRCHRAGYLTARRGPGHQGTYRPAGDPDAARTRGARPRGARPAQQANRLRSRNQRGHGQASPQQRQRERCRPRLSASSFAPGIPCLLLFASSGPERSMASMRPGTGTTRGEASRVTLVGSLFAWPKRLWRRSWMTTTTLAGRFGEWAGLSHWPSNSLIPAGTERSEAQWRDPFCCLDDKRRRALRSG